MGKFEIFLLSSSILSLSIGIRLFYENCELAKCALDALNKQIELTEDLVLAYKEIEMLKKKLK